jgi:hypothetical protein
VVAAIVISIAVLTTGAIIVLNKLAGPVAPSPGRLDNGQPTPTCADVGNHDSGAPAPLWYGPFRSTYELAGGRAELGCPRDDDSSGYVHTWGPGESQDLTGGRVGVARIMALDAKRVIVMTGNYWHDFTDRYKNNAAPLMGYPTTDPIRCGSARMVLLEGGEQSPGAMVTDARTHRYVWVPRLTWERYRSLGGLSGSWACRSVLWKHPTPRRSSASSTAQSQSAMGVH